VPYQNRPIGQRGRVRLGVVAVVAAAALLVGACGSSSSKSSTGSSGTSAPSGGSATTSGGSTSSKPTGTPLNVMTIASVDYNGPTYAMILTTAKLFGEWVNEHGGIDGHPLDVTTCDEKGDPNMTAQCGREAIANHDVAVVGSFTLNGDSIIPELQAADTSWFGICCAVAADELTSPISQQIGSGLSLAPALAVKAAEDGCKKIALVQGNDGALDQFTTTLVDNGLKSVNGPALDKNVLVPLTAEDYASPVQQATSGTDCIIADLGESLFPAFMTAFQQQGAHQRLYGAQGNLDITVTKPFPQSTQGAVIAGSYSDISLPAWADYRAAIAQFHAPSDENYNSLGGLGTWAGYVAFQQIIEKMTGPITNKTFLAAAQQATVTLPGMTATVNFTVPFTAMGPSFRNAMNRTVTYDIAQNGNLTAFQNGKFYDMTNAMIGSPLSAANTPPGGG
jgi:branched-chain amino acid transport system substrate-binding protein